MSQFRYGFRPVHVGFDFGTFSSDTATKASTLASSMQQDNAYNYGKSAGIQAAEGKQARVPSNFYGAVDAEGTDMSNPQNRAAFDKGFYAGYDEAAKGLGTVGPGGLTATQVLKDITIAESKKVEDVYGARQTMLDVHYKAFDKLVNDEKSKYNSMQGGVAFLGEWRGLMNDWTAASAGQLQDDMLNLYEGKLETARVQREALIAADSAFKGYSNFPSLTQPLPVPGVPKPVGPTPAKPAVPGGTPAAGKILGMSKGVALGVGLLLIAGIGTGVYFATREEYELGPDGKPRIGPDGKPIPKRKQGQNGAGTAARALPPPPSPRAQSLPMPPPVPMMEPPRRY